MEKKVENSKIKDVVINGVNYKIQKPSALWYTQMTDRCTNRSGVLMKFNYVEELFKYVVVEPKDTSISSFEEDIGGMEELVSEIEVFLRRK
jgi:hypothetical protein